MDEHFVKSARSGGSDGVPYAAHIDTLTPTSHTPSGTWRVGLFGCFTDVIPNCAMVTLCPCVSVAQVASKLEVMEKFSSKFRLSPYWIALLSSLVVVVAQYVMLALFINQVAVIVTSDSVVWGYIKYKYHHWGEDDTWYVHLILAGLFYVLFSIAVWQLRARARSQFQVRGSWFEDCWSSLWCPCCSLAQTATQVKSYTPGSCSFGPPPADTLPPYSQH
jgi:Cys-rich protein (TIGR01571 family)